MIARLNQQGVNSGGSPFPAAPPKSTGVQSLVVWGRKASTLHLKKICQHH